MGHYGHGRHCRRYDGPILLLRIGKAVRNKYLICHFTVFSKDLLTDPSVRNVHGIRHEIAAVASSTSAEKAAQFMSRINGPQSTKLYGSYKALISDSDVDIVYVATPHSHHFQNAMLALKAGKNVLCEKPLTVTAAQARRLVDTATEQSLFLMEAVKTRFFPASIQIRERIASGEIGTVYRTFGRSDQFPIFVIHR